MSDLISRQAVIDAITNYAKYLWDKFHETCNLAGMIETIEGVPSAQRWIPASERLPGYGEQVVANFRNEQIGRNRIGVSYCYVQKEGFFSDVPFEYKVVAWMPLPEPYKEGQDDRT